MENKRLFFVKLKEKLKSVSLKTWIFVGIIAAFVILAVVLILVAMHVNGYTLAGFISAFWPWIVLIVTLLLVLILTYIFYKLKKGN